MTNEVVNLDSNYLIDDLEKPHKSKVYKKLPKYQIEGNERIAIQAGTGLGKTTLAMATADLFLTQGAKHVIVAFPKIMIGANKADDTWEMIHNGISYGENQYPTTFLCTYDNIYRIPHKVLENSVVWLDELHEFATSSFRPMLRILINELFTACPYIIGMSGTISQHVFGQEFPLFIKVVEKERVRRILHGVIATVEKNHEDKDTTYSTYSPQHFIEHRFAESKAIYFIVFVKNKNILHLLQDQYQNSAVYHSGESTKTIESCENGKSTVLKGKFPDGIKILFTTSGSVAGWDLQGMKEGDCEVIIADTHKNLSSLETIYQAVSRIRGVDEVHVYKMQSPLDDNTIDTSPIYNHDDILENYHNRVQELKIMSEKKIIFTNDGDKIMNHITRELYYVSKWEHINSALLRSYSEFSSVPQNIREAYAKKIVGFNEVYRENITRSSGLAPNQNGKREMLCKILSTVDERLSNDDIRNFLNDAFLCTYNVSEAAGEDILNEIAIWAQDNKTTMTNTVKQCLELLSIYEREDLVAYYSTKDEDEKRKEPSTLLNYWKVFKETSVLNHKVRNSLIIWFEKRDWITTKDEFIKWVKQHEGLFADKKNYKKMLVKNRRLDGILQGLFNVIGKVDDSSVEVKISPLLPMNSGCLLIKKDKLNEELSLRISGKASRSRTIKRWLG